MSKLYMSKKSMLHRHIFNYYFLHYLIYIHIHIYFTLSTTTADAPPPPLHIAAQP